MLSLWVRDGNSLKPASEEAEKYFTRIGKGETVTAEIRRPRNIRFHRKFFALCAFIAEHAPGNYTAYQIAKLLELRTGHCDAIKTTKGIESIPRDINFAAMDEIEFGQLYEDCWKYLSEEFLPHVEDAAFRREFEKFAA